MFQAIILIQALLLAIALFYTLVFIVSIRTNKTDTKIVITVTLCWTAFYIISHSFPNI